MNVPKIPSDGRCAEKGKKLIDNYEGVWDILEERS